MAVERVGIFGVAGRDGHGFNTYFRDQSAYEVIAFTVMQIPGIANRRYPLPSAVPAIPKAFPFIRKRKQKFIFAMENCSSAAWLPR